MNEGFTEALRQEVKTTQIVIDRFHVAVKYRDTADEICKQELKRRKHELDEVAYKELKGSMWAFCKQRKDWTSEDRQVLRCLFAHAPILKLAYDQSHLSTCFP